MIRPVNWRPHLQEGEVLLWQGRATPALRLIAPVQAEWLIGGIGAVIVAMLIVARRALPAALGDGAALVGLVALLAALFVTGYPFRQMHQRAQALRRRQYALTDRRILVATGKPPQIAIATRAPAALSARGEPTPGLATLIVPVQGRLPVELPHVTNADAVLKLVQAVAPAAPRSK